MALGRALFATKGYAAPTAGETLARARALAEQLDRSDCLGPLLYGQWLFHVNRSELKLALSFAERLERIGEAHDDDGLLLLGHLVHGISRMNLGDFVAARVLFERCHRLDDPAHRAVRAAMLSHAANGGPKNSDFARRSSTAPWAYFLHLTAAPTSAISMLAAAQRGASLLASLSVDPATAEPVTGSQPLRERSGFALMSGATPSSERPRALSCTIQSSFCRPTTTLSLI